MTARTLIHTIASFAAVLMWIGAWLIIGSMT